MDMSALCTARPVGEEKSDTRIGRPPARRRLRLPGVGTSGNRRRPQPACRHFSWLGTPFLLAPSEPTWDPVRYARADFDRLESLVGRGKACACARAHQAAAFGEPASLCPLRRFHTTGMRSRAIVVRSSKKACDGRRPRRRQIGTMFTKRFAGAAGETAARPVFQAERTVLVVLEPRTP
jgi:hypothetical protein